MYDTTELSKSTLYRIQGRTGDWRYSHRIPGACPKFVFWRFASNCPNRRISIEISQGQVLERVWESPSYAQQVIRSVDITRLEAFSEI